MFGEKYKKTKDKKGTVHHKVSTVPVKNYGGGIMWGWLVSWEETLQENLHCSVLDLSDHKEVSGRASGAACEHL